MLSEVLITNMVIAVAVVTTVLLTYLTIQIYRVEDGARLPSKRK